jgi:hypothetical protein
VGLGSLLYWVLLSLPLSLVSSCLLTASLSVVGWHLFV